MIIRQTRALLVLLFRNWTRRAMRPGDAPKRGFPSTLILNLLFLAYFTPMAWKIGTQVAELGPLRASGMRVGLYGFALLAVSNALSLLMPEMGKLRSPLRHALLDDLPVSPFAVMIVTWLQGAPYLAISSVFLFGLAPELRASTAGFVYLVGFALALSMSACAVGMAAVSLVRAGVPAHVRRSLVWIYVVTMLLGLLAVMNSPAAARFGFFLAHDPMRWLGEALTGAHQLSAIVAVLSVGLAGLAVTAFCEMRGYDRIDTASPNRLRERARGVLSMATTERLLFSREQGKRALIITFVISAIILVGAGRYLMRRGGGAEFAIGMALNLVYLPSLLALQFASFMVKRDVGARPFLSALPLSPHQTLEGKIATLRRYVFPFTLLMLPLAWMALPKLGVWVVVWRLAAYFSALWLLCGAAVPVAFLTNGLGAPSGFGASGSFATTLLMFPTMSACLALNPFAALVSLGMLAAIEREARRAATRCVQWIDDAGEVERETAAWRALLVLATFFAAQGLIAQLFAVIGIKGGYAIALIYGISAIVLALLTHRQRLPRLRLMPHKLSALPLGVLAGVVSAALSLGFLKLVLRLGWTPPGADEASPHGGALWALLIAVVIMAPLAEEPFFRGWLQGAIALELPPARRWQSIIFGALAFAAVHVGSIYVPQLILGLLAGALYYWSGGLLPGILAHALHNGLSSFFER